ncbi:hypothetical protein EDD86DRAFT_256353 [Gorgonomyces haynaldii]|nr:hypothetical protein EDD86DRAFT_256353 [Gorgonomyces haynaldii]
MFLALDCLDPSVLISPVWSMANCLAKSPCAGGQSQGTRTPALTAEMWSPFGLAWHSGAERPAGAPRDGAKDANPASTLAFGASGAGQVRLALIAAPGSVLALVLPLFFGGSCFCGCSCFGGCAGGGAFPDGVNGAWPESCAFNVTDPAGQQKEFWSVMIASSMLRFLDASEPSVLISPVWSMANCLAKSPCAGGQSQGTRTPALTAEMWSPFGLAWHSGAERPAGAPRDGAKDANPASTLAFGASGAGQVRLALIAAPGSVLALVLPLFFGGSCFCGCSCFGGCAGGGAFPDGVNGAWPESCAFNVTDPAGQQKEFWSVMIASSMLRFLDASEPSVLISPVWSMANCLAKSPCAGGQSQGTRTPALTAEMWSPFGLAWHSGAERPAGAPRDGAKDANPASTLAFGASGAGQVRLALIAAPGSVLALVLPLFFGGSCFCGCSCFGGCAGGGAFPDGVNGAWPESCAFNVTDPAGQQKEFWSVMIASSMLRFLDASEPSVLISPVWSMANCLAKSPCAGGQSQGTRTPALTAEMWSPFGLAWHSGAERPAGAPRDGAKDANPASTLAFGASGAGQVRLALIAAPGSFAAGREYTVDKTENNMPLVEQTTFYTAWAPAGSLCFKNSHRAKSRFGYLRVAMTH